MSDHTPGPWRVIEPQEDKLRPYGVQMGKEGGFMVPCYTVEQSKHNSKLIAAAPDMLAALESMVLYYGWQQSEGDESERLYKFVRKTLAKAKGEAE